MTRITTLPPGHIFVFGSNLAGRHGAGAALDARRYFGAVQGIGEGPMGRCYAVPTKDHQLVRRSLRDIQDAVEWFLAYAADNPTLMFHVTPIGCGLAGYRADQIAPMFRGAPINVVLPTEFERFLWRGPAGSR